jgi:hypothetical protein
MNDIITSKIEELVSILRTASPDNAIAFNLSVNSQDTEYAFTLKEPNILKENGISMKNLNGQWIEQCKKI